MAASTRLRLARVVALTCSLGVAGWMVLRAQHGTRDGGQDRGRAGAPEEPSAVEDGGGAGGSGGSEGAAGPVEDGVVPPDASGGEFLFSSKSLAIPPDEPVSASPFLSTSKSLAPMSPELLEALKKELSAESQDPTFLSTSKSLQPVFLPTSKSAGPPAKGFFFDDGEDPVFEAGGSAPPSTAGGGAGDADAKAPDEPPVNDAGEASKSTPKGSGR